MRLNFFIKSSVDAQRDRDILVAHLIAGCHNVNTGEVHQCAEDVPELVGRKLLDEDRQTARFVLLRWP